MAANVFGTPITKETMAGMPEYANRDTITRLDMARSALHLRNANWKEDVARQYVDQLKVAYGRGASTKCLIYNATGDKITFVLKYDYHGQVFVRSTYPREIANGQWGAFLHVHGDAEAVGSSAAVVFRGKNNVGESREWCLAWMTPSSSDLDNYVYAEAREADHFYQADWNAIKSKMGKSGRTHVDTRGGCVSKATTETGTTVYVTGIMTLDDAA